MLLLAGSITDVVGPRRVELVACFMLGVFGLGCGLAKTGLQLTLFRAFHGVALAVHLPAAVSIVTATVPKGKARNLSFAALGFARDIGYSVGLVLSGVLIETSGWRLNFYLAGGAILLVTGVEVWGLPKEDPREARSGSLIKQVYHNVDWVGGFIISTGLALLAYVLACV
jgi:MFS family permease